MLIRHFGFKFFVDFFIFQLIVFAKIFEVFVIKLQHSFHLIQTLFVILLHYMHFLVKQYAFDLIMQLKLYIFDLNFFQDFQHLGNHYHQHLIDERKIFVFLSLCFYYLNDQFFHIDFKFFGHHNRLKVIFI
jgi:hypothetical protein